MIVLIDQDDVIVDYERELFRILKGLYPEHADFFRERSHFNLDNEFPLHILELVNSVRYSLDFNLLLPPVPGSLEALAEISQKGHEVMICSSPHSYYENCVREKYAWVEKYLGRAWVERLILTPDKTLVTGDLLIDDKPEITGRKTPLWEHVLYTRKYNQYVQGKRRMTWVNWKEVLYEL